LDEVEEINEYWSLWRPITMASPGLIYAAMQFDPRSSGRVYWENGEYVRNLPPFALPKDWEFPEPIGKQETHIIEHGEPMAPFIPAIRQKGLKRVVCRGVFHYGWTRLGRVLLENGIFEAEPIEINGVKVSPYEVIMKHIERHAVEKWEDPYTIAKKLGFKPQDILSVEIIGSKSGMANRIIYYCEPRYPFFDGKPVTASMEYGSFVGVAGSVSLQMLAHGEIPEKGAFHVETSGVSAKKLFNEYEKRGFKFTKQVSFRT
jgi:saccharopine dehydrogenase-like NADP-dependent oxidoreductase